ncbi:Hypothetical protein GLP15_3106 [Giardia lamblia P15]|uniref:Uncharacterized protein n=1 Tax=Giardia intestinalis (strain P15) TaxID=658858 RepID=E1F2S5_GIAIA|nr:Hypothetical protein GLP15_3106 [Giardia lamblia P15]
MTLLCPEIMAGSLGMVATLADSIVQCALLGVSGRKLTDFLLYPGGALEYMSLLHVCFSISNQVYNIRKRDGNSWTDVTRLGLQLCISILSIGASVLLVDEQYLIQLILSAIAFALAIGLLGLTEALFQRMLLWRAAVGLQVVSLLYRLILHSILYAKRVRWELDVDYYHVQEYNLCIAIFVTCSTLISISTTNPGAAVCAIAVLLGLTIRSTLKRQLGAFRNMCIGCLVLAIVNTAQVVYNTELRRPVQKSQQSKLIKNGT